MLDYIIVLNNSLQKHLETKKELTVKQFILALTFLTRLYIPNRYKVDENDFAGSIWFYPIIGLIIGGILSAVHWGFLSLTKETDVLALVLVISYIFLSGGLHLDGLADSFDGLFSGRDKVRIFEIMQDSRIGSFGVIGLILYFITLIILFQHVNWIYILLFPLVGRCSILLAAGVSSYAKEKGMGKIIVDAAGVKHVIYSIVLSFAIGAALDIKSLIPISITYALVFLMTKVISKKLSGITGDIMGMTVEVSQCLFLLVTFLI